MFKYINTHSSHSYLSNSEKCLNKKLNLPKVTIIEKQIASTRF